MRRQDARRLRVRRESLRQLTPTELTAAAGGRNYQPRTTYCTKSGTLFVPEEPDSE